MTTTGCRLLQCDRLRRGRCVYVAYRAANRARVAGTRTAHCAARSTGKGADRETRAANAVSKLLVRPREDV